MDGIGAAGKYGGNIERNVGEKKRGNWRGVEEK